MLSLFGQLCLLFWSWFMWPKWQQPFPSLWSSPAGMPSSNCTAQATVRAPSNVEVSQGNGVRSREGVQGIEVGWEKGPQDKKWQDSDTEVPVRAEQDNQGQWWHIHDKAGCDEGGELQDHWQGCKRGPLIQILLFESAPLAHGQGQESDQGQGADIIFEIHWHSTSVLLWREAVQCGLHTQPHFIICISGLGTDASVQMDIHMSSLDNFYSKSRVKYTHAGP